MFKNTCARVKRSHTDLHFLLQSRPAIIWHSDLHPVVLVHVFLWSGLRLTQQFLFVPLHFVHVSSQNTCGNSLNMFIKVATSSLVLLQLSSSQPPHFTPAGTASVYSVYSPCVFIPARTGVYNLHQWIRAHVYGMHICASRARHRHLCSHGCVDRVFALRVVLI